MSFAANEREFYSVDGKPVTALKVPQIKDWQGYGSRHSALTIVVYSDTFRHVQRYITYARKGSSRAFL
jgi:hypothetical protein